jgi:hypothetical protein
MLLSLHETLCLWVFPDLSLLCLQCSVTCVCRCHPKAQKRRSRKRRKKRLCSIWKRWKTKPSMTRRRCFRLKRVNRKKLVMPTTNRQRARSGRLPVALSLSNLWGTQTRATSARAAAKLSTGQRKRKKPGKRSKKKKAGIVVSDDNKDGETEVIDAFVFVFRRLFQATDGPATIPYEEEVRSLSTPLRRGSGLILRLFSGCWGRS